MNKTIRIDTHQPSTTAPHLTRGAFERCPICGVPACTTVVALVLTLHVCLLVVGVGICEELVRATLRLTATATPERA